MAQQNPYVPLIRQGQAGDRAAQKIVTQGEIVAIREILRTEATGGVAGRLADTSVVRYECDVEVIGRGGRPHLLTDCASPVEYIEGDLVYLEASYGDPRQGVLVTGRVQPLLPRNFQTFFTAEQPVAVTSESLFATIWKAAYAPTRGVNYFRLLLFLNDFTVAYPESVFRRQTELAGEPPHQHVYTLDQLADLSYIQVRVGVDERPDISQSWGVASVVMWSSGLLTIRADQTMTVQDSVLTEYLIQHPNADMSIELIIVLPPQLKGVGLSLTGGIALEELAAGTP